MSRSLLYRCAIASILVLSLNGCLYRTHNVATRYSTAQLQTATLDDLVQRLNAAAAQIQTLNATVNIAASVGGPKKGKATEYQEISGYVLVKKPSMLHIIGLIPLVRSRLFDMVSDGTTFKLSLPPKNRFVVGHNEITKPSDKPLENLRPHVFFDSLLLHEVHPDEIPILEVGEETVKDPKSKKDVLQADYELRIVRPMTSGAGKNSGFLSRKVIFSRTDLKPHQQLIYDQNGNVATEATYEGFTSYNGIEFPSVILVKRPQEEYEIRLAIVKLTINGPLTADQFQLNQPEGSKLQTLD